MIRLAQGHAPLMSTLPSHLAALGLLAAAFWLPGHALERALLRDADLGPLRAPARIALGVAAWMLWAFALASLSQLNAAGVAAGAGLGAAAAALAHWRLPRRRGPEWKADAAFAGALLLFTAPLLPLDASVSWDASAYHLTLPKLYLAASGFRPVAMNVYAHWPLGTELLFGVAMLVRDHVAAKGVHFGLGLATLYATYAGCRAFHRPESGWLAAALVLANPIVLFEMGVAYVDLATAFFFTCGVLFAARAADTPDRAAPFWLAGVCGAAAAATKLTGIAAAGVIAAVALPAVIGRARRGDRAPLRRLALGTGIPLAALWLPWLVRSALDTGNPVYPFLWSWLGGPDWSAALGEQFAAWQRSIGMGRSPLDTALLPVRVILTGGGGYDRFHGDIGDFWIALLPLSLLGLRRPIVRRCLGGSALFFLIWAAGSQQMRFLIPVLPLWAIAAAVTLVGLAERLPAPARRAAPAALALGAAALVLAVGSRPYAGGLARLARLASGAAIEAPRVEPVDRFIDSELPADARLLLLDTNQGFFVEREYLADSFFEASQILDWLRPFESVEAVHRALVARGITHVMTAPPRWGIRWPAPLRALLRDPAHALRRYRSPDGRFELFELQ